MTAAEREPMLRWFRYEHLSEGPMRAMSAQFAGLAWAVCDRVPGSAERTVALRKLLEAKDAAVRAVVDQLTEGGTPPGPNRPDASFQAREEDPGVAPRVCVCGQPEGEPVHDETSPGTYHDFVPRDEAQDFTG